MTEKNKKSQNDDLSKEQAPNNAQVMGTIMDAGINILYIVRHTAMYDFQIERLLSKLRLEGVDLELELGMLLAGKFIDTERDHFNSFALVQLHTGCPVTWKRQRMVRITDKGIARLDQLKVVSDVKFNNWFHNEVRKTMENHGPVKLDYLILSILSICPASCRLLVSIFSNAGMAVIFGEVADNLLFLSSLSRRRLRKQEESDVYELTERGHALLAETHFDKDSSYTEIMNVIRNEIQVFIHNRQLAGFIDDVEDLQRVIAKGKDMTEVQQKALDEALQQTIDEAPSVEKPKSPEEETTVNKFKASIDDRLMRTPEWKTVLAVLIGDYVLTSPQLRKVAKKLDPDSNDGTTVEAMSFMLKNHLACVESKNNQFKLTSSGTEAAMKLSYLGAINIFSATIPAAVREVVSEEKQDDCHNTPADTNKIDLDDLIHETEEMCRRDAEEAVKTIEKLMGNFFPKGEISSSAFANRFLPRKHLDLVRESKSVLDRFRNIENTVDNLKSNLEIAEAKIFSLGEALAQARHTAEHEVAKFQQTISDLQSKLDTLISGGTAYVGKAINLSLSDPAIVMLKILSKAPDAIGFVYIQTQTFISVKSLAEELSECIVGTTDVDGKRTCVLTPIGKETLRLCKDVIKKIDFNNINAVRPFE